MTAWKDRPTSGENYECEEQRKRKWIRDDNGFDDASVAQCNAHDGTDRDQYIQNSKK